MINSKSFIQKRKRKSSLFYYRDGVLSLVDQLKEVAVSTQDKKDNDKGGVIRGGLREAVRQMDDLHCAISKNGNKGEKSRYHPLPEKVRFQNTKNDNEKGVFRGDVRDAVRQMDELCRLINKNSKK